MVNKSADYHMTYSHFMHHRGVFPNRCFAKKLVRFYIKEHPVLFHYYVSPNLES